MLKLLTFSWTMLVGLSALAQWVKPEFSGFNDTVEQRLASVVDRGIRSLPSPLAKRLPREIHFKPGASGPSENKGIYAWIDAIVVEKGSSLVVPKELVQRLGPMLGDGIYLRRALISGLIKMMSSTLELEYDFAPYLRLVGLTRGHQENKEYPFTADLKRPQNLKEALAFDLTMMLTDESYFCAKPASFLILNKILDLGIPRPNCEPYNRVPIISYTENIKKMPLVFELKAEDVISIDYVKVESGSQYHQMFGHAMLRVTLCKPHQQRSDCIKNPMNKFFISYRAVNSLLDRKDSLRKPIQGFLIPYRDIKLEYTTKDDRNLEIYPLDLSDDEMQLLIYAFLEKLATDQRSYDLMGFNCATASADMINIVLIGKKPIDYNIKTPSGLIADLRAHQLIREKDVQVVNASSKDIKMYCEELGKSVENLCPSYEKLKAMSFAQRLNLWNHEIAKISDVDRKNRALVLVVHIENIMIRLLETKAVRKINAALKRALHPKAFSHPSEQEIALGNLFVERDEKLQEAILAAYNRQTYGLPASEEVKIQNGQFDALRIAQDGIHNLIEKMIAAELAEIKEIETFVKRHYGI